MSLERNICHEVGCQLVQSCCHDIKDLPVSEEEIHHFQGYEEVDIRQRNPITERQGYLVNIKRVCPHNVNGGCDIHGQIEGCKSVPVGGRVCTWLRKRDGKGPVPGELIFLDHIAYSK